MPARILKESRTDTMIAVGQETGCKAPDASCKGFTLIEVLLVIAVIGILSTIAVPAYSSYMQKARASAAVLAVGVIQRAITAYYVESNSYPASLADVGMDTMRDPWGNPYQYLRIAGATATKASNSQAAPSSGGSSNPSTSKSNSGKSSDKGTDTSGSTASGSSSGSASKNGGSSDPGSSGTNGMARKDHFMVPINTDYDLYSMGPDGKSASPLTAAISQDDIIRASDGAFIGRACDF